MPSLVLVLLSTVKDHMRIKNENMFESECLRQGDLCLNLLDSVFHR